MKLLRFSRPIKFKIKDSDKLTGLQGWSDILNRMHADKDLPSKLGSRRSHRFSLFSLLLIPLVIAPGFLAAGSDVRTVAYQGIYTVALSFAYVLALSLVAYRRKEVKVKPVFWYMFSGTLHGAVYFFLLIIPPAVSWLLHAGEGWSYEWTLSCFELQQGFLKAMMIYMLIGAAVGGILGLAFSCRQASQTEVLPAVAEID